MASIYQRPDSNNFQLSCYPRPGAKLLRASLETDNGAEAEKIARAVELLIQLERYADIHVPQKLLAELPGVRSLMGGESLASATSPVSKDQFSKPSEAPMCSIDGAIRALIKRSFDGENVHHATLDKISRFRQFFGPERINALDPRPDKAISVTRSSSRS